MSTAQPRVKVPVDALKRALLDQLFPGEEGVNAFAVLDGASVPELLKRLYGEAPPEFVCLYRGQLEPDMAEVAPYLVRLKEETPFTNWLMEEGWGKHWGIYVLAAANLKVMRRHFRTFLMVRDPEGKQVYFRYYDPRVLRIYLPTCTAQELGMVFGPVLRYGVEAEDAKALLLFQRDGTGLKRNQVQVAATGVSRTS